MNPSHYYDKALLLLQQNRYSDAKQLLHQYLATSPNDDYALSLLALALVNSDETSKALEAIDQSITLHPGNAYHYGIKGQIQLKQEEYDEALRSLEMALALQPHEVDFWELKAIAHHDKKEYEKAIEAADQGLSVNPESILCLNIKAGAQHQMNRKEDVSDIMLNALRIDPNNSFTHSNYGYQLLMKGQHKEAKNHLMEALKLNPNDHHAVEGVKIALKQSYLPYKLLWKFNVWLADKGKGFQWGLIVGIYFAQRFSSSMAMNYPGLAPLFWTIYAILIIAVLSSWLINPLSNAMLILHKIGRHILSFREKLSGLLTLGSLVVGGFSLAGYFAFSDENFLLMAIYFGIITIPLGTSVLATYKRPVIISIAVGICMIGAVELIRLFMGLQGSILMPAFTLSILGYQFLANYFAIHNESL